jgi:hypothetical protein
MGLWLAEMSSAESRAILSRPNGNSELALDQAFLWMARTVSLTQPLPSPAAHTSTDRTHIYIYLLLRMDGKLREGCVFAGVSFPEPQSARARFGCPRFF